jgi:3-hydroxyisobutyrate dehydrogenase-like beta-hydroxyacid dehydrogenase
MKVGFIGLGHMGGHMARHLLEAGFDLSVCDVRKEAAKPLLDKGAKWADTPEIMAKTCQVVVSCLPGPADVEQIVYGASGLLKSWKTGDIYIDMSTNSPTLLRKIAVDAKPKGVAVLDAPVSGGEPGAKAATLAIMVGGDAAILDKARPVLEKIGAKIFHMGDIGCGNVAKLVNNLISITCNAITAEGFVLGARAGIDCTKLQELVNVSTGNNFTAQHYHESVLQGNFNPGFRVALAAKDISLAMALSKEYGIPLPVGSAAEQRLIEAKAAGLGDKHIDSIITLLEKLAGVQVRSAGK